MLVLCPRSELSRHASLGSPMVHRSGTAMVREKSGLPPTPRELKVRTPAHRKQLGWYAELEPRVTQAATHYRAHRSPAPRLPSRHRRCRCARGGRSRRASPGTSHRPRAGSGPLQPRSRFWGGGRTRTRTHGFGLSLRRCAHAGGEWVGWGDDFARGHKLNGRESSGSGWLFCSNPLSLG